MMYWTNVGYQASVDEESTTECEKELKKTILTVLFGTHMQKQR